MHYEEEIENSIKFLIKLENVEDCDTEKLEKKFSVYDTNVVSKIEDWIYNTPTKQEIAEFALKNQDRWGTEPQMVLYAIEDYASTCGIYLNEDETPKVRLFWPFEIYLSMLQMCTRLRRNG